MNTLPSESELSNRRGITALELLWGMVFLTAALWVLSRPSYRAVEIARAATGEMRYDTIVAVAVFLLTLFFCFGLAIGIHRLRIRYGVLLYFPLMVGLPLGFAVVPFPSFSLPVYGLLLATSVIVISLLLFFLQSVVMFFYRATPHRKRNPIPEELPPFSPGYVRQRTKPENVKEGIPHPNRTPAWENFFNSVGIHQGYAADAYHLDADVKEFRNQYSIYCRKLLLHYRQPSGYVWFWDRETEYLATIIEPCAAIDFEAARDWSEYVMTTIPANTHILSRRDERLVKAMCVVILNEDVELALWNHELAKPAGWLDRMVTREPEYWHDLIVGLVERDAERCREAIRIQAEKWYIPSLSDYYRLNVNGIAMTNLCRWRGIPVPALEPVIPELLLLNENTQGTSVRL